MAEACGYCGRFMRLVDYGAESGSEWVCSQQRQHILDDPEHWSIPIEGRGCVDASKLTHTELVDALTERENGDHNA